MYLKFPTKKSGFPIANKADLDYLAQQILMEYMPETLVRATALDLDQLLHNYIILDVTEANLYPENILGFIAFSDIKIPLANGEVLDVTEGTIVLDEQLKENKARYRFTLAHEAAHWVLHRSYYCQDNKVYEFRKKGYSYIACKTDKTELGRKNPKEAKTDDEWAEWQADYLAAALLMPKTPFIKAAKAALLRHNFPNLQLVSGERVEEGTQVVKELAKLFQVSMRAIRIRMRNFYMYSGDALKPF